MVSYNLPISFKIGSLAFKYHICDVAEVLPFLTKFQCNTSTFHQFTAAIYRKVSNISLTKSSNLDDTRLV